MSRNQNGLILFLFPRAKQAFRDKVEACLNVQDIPTEDFRDDVWEAVDDLRQLIYDRCRGPSLETKIATAQKRLDALKAELPERNSEPRSKRVQGWPAHYIAQEHPDPAAECEFDDLVDRYF